MTPMDPTERPQCSARSKRSGEQCKNKAVLGGSTCRMHGSATKRAKAAAERRVQETLAARAAATYGLPRDVDPATALLEEVHRSAGHVAWLGQKVRELGDTDLVWSLVEETDKAATLSPGTDRKMAARPSVWLELYQRERKHLAVVARSALDAGISERLVHLAEQQGAALAEVIRRSMDAVLAEVCAMVPGKEAARFRDAWPAMLARIVPAEIAAVTGAEEQL